MTAASAHERGRDGQRTLLLLVERRNSSLRRQLTRAGYTVIESFTTDHAVAVCVNNRIDAVILDQSCFVETDGWSVAQSVKAAKPNVCVLLVSPSKRLSKRMPKGVDAMVGAEDHPQVLAQLESLLGKAS